MNVEPMFFLSADNSKKDSDSTPVKGGADMGEQKAFVSCSILWNCSQMLFIAVIDAK